MHVLVNSSFENSNIFSSFEKFELKEITVFDISNSKKLRTVLLNCYETNIYEGYVSKGINYNSYNIIEPQYKIKAISCIY